VLPCRVLIVTEEEEAEQDFRTSVHDPRAAFWDLLERAEVPLDGAPGTQQSQGHSTPEMETAPTAAVCTCSSNYLSHYYVLSIFWAHDRNGTFVSVESVGRLRSETLTSQEDEVLCCAARHMCWCIVHTGQ
jgi:hypothetical protein